MNQVIENIKNRRSVRSYEDKPVSKELIETLLDAARWAPTGANFQPWRFVVVQDKEFHGKLVKHTMPRYKKWLSQMPEEFQRMREESDKKMPDPFYYGAPVVIFVIGSGPNSSFDCPMACQNIMLAARSLGLGTCWVYIGQLATEDSEVKEALGLKEGEKVFGPIILGYPKGGFPQPPAKNQPKVKWI